MGVIKTVLNTKFVDQLEMHEYVGTNLMAIMQIELLNNIYDRLEVLTSSTIQFFSVSVLGLRLPPRGVDPALGRALTVSSNSSLGEILRINIKSVQLVPYFNTSELYFSPGKIGVNVGILFIFQFSFQLEINDTIAVYLPGVRVDASTLVNTDSTLFSVSWSASTYILTMKTLQILPLMTRTTVIGRRYASILVYIYA